MKRRRTIVVTTTFPQFEGDPRGAFIRTHWEQRAASGQDVIVLAPQTAWCSGALSGTCGVRRVHYAPASWSTLTGNFGILENVRARPWRAGLVPALWFALRRTLEQMLHTWRPDRVAAHMLVPGGWIVAAACNEASVPFELYGHGTDVDVLMRAPSFVRERFWTHASRAERIHLPSREKQQKFCRTFALSEDDVRLHVEPMVHCVPPPAQAPDDEHRARRRPEVLYLGRLIEQKGVDDLLQAIATMSPQPRLHVAGDGPHRRRLQRMARRLGIEAHFHGYVVGAAKERLLGEAGVLCVPSRNARGGLSEGAPLVIREALACGLPVVATSVGGIPELCRGEGRVRLVATGNPRALAQALSGMLSMHGPTPWTRTPLRTVS